jgi:beta-glucosidase/6-phospho-beta-glucosidase/beta-galactosidase
LDSFLPSFFTGGFECSAHLLAGGTRLDVSAASRHEHFAAADYARCAQAGLLGARDGLRWHRIERRPGRYDFSCDLPLLHAARDVGVEVIWDLCHYGWPDYLDVWSLAFVDRFARFARAATETIAEHTSGPLRLAPINEISFFAWAGGDAGYFQPFGSGRGDELKAQLVRAAIAGTEAIWEVAPEARIVHIDPLMRIVPAPDRPQDAEAAAAHTASQYHAWDMLAGLERPELGGDPKYLDVVGVNFYHNNQWLHDGPTLWRDDPLYRPFREMIAEVHRRYRRPLFVAETGAEWFMRPEWMSYVGREVRAALEAGVPVGGICWYPILDHPGWGDDRHCTNGLWGYPDAAGERPICTPLRDEIERQRELFSELLGRSPQ